MEVERKIRLSTDYLKNVIMNNDEENIFTFKIFVQNQKNENNENNKSKDNKRGEKNHKKGSILKEIKLNRFFADFISPKVSKIHQTDPTINEFNIYFDFGDNLIKKTINDNIINGHEKEKISKIIENFFKLSYGEMIEITEENYSIMKKLAKLIGNIEIHRKIKEMSEKLEKEIGEKIEEKTEKEITVKRIIEELEKKEKGIIRKKKIEFASKHFYEISTEEIIKLNIETIYEIISNEHLLIEDEDSFFDFFKQIQCKIESDPLYNDRKKRRFQIFDFYEKIEFEGLSEKKLQEFIEIFDYNDMTNCLWQKLCRCFHPTPKVYLSNKRYLIKTRIFEPKSKDRFDGIINHLTKENGGNVVDKGIIDVVSSSVNNNHMSKYSIDLYNQNNYFQSCNVNNSWLCYDFREKKVCPTHYSIRSRNDGDKGCYHLQSWVIEGTNEETEYSNKKWEIIDEKKNETSLNDRNAENTFQIMKRTNNFYRYLRIRITDIDTAKNHFLTISALEYFGRIQ